jgi:hypothetical protein
VETGEWKEVGSTCVRDFIGYDPSAFMFYASIDFPDLCGRCGDSFGRNLHSFRLNDVLTVTNAVISKFGWRSKSAAYNEGGESTADRVWDNLDPSPEFLRNHSDELVTVTDDDKKIASDAYEYFKTVDAGDNDYLMTCKKIAELGYVPYKHMGYACSMINGYNRYLEKESYKKNLTISTPVSGWVGEVKERITVKVKCLFSKEIETMYGLSTLFIFVDEKGNIFKTFYSGSNMNAEKDGVYDLTGTVKRHSEYKGKKETMLNRCKVVENNTEFAFVDNGLIKEDDFQVS